jgi:riboflavin synthase
LGHVDTEAKLHRIVNKGDYHRLEVGITANFKRYVVPNGSIALEGISLTVKDVLPRIFSVDIVPFTYKNTNLMYRKVGDWLNIEFDYLLKQEK